MTRRLLFSAATLILCGAFATLPACTGSAPDADDQSDRDAASKNHDDYSAPDDADGSSDEDGAADDGDDGSSQLKDTTGHSGDVDTADAGDGAAEGESCSQETSTSCGADADCGEGEVCKGGTCSRQKTAGCRSNADCEQGQVCKDDPDSCDPATCVCVEGTWQCEGCDGTVCMERAPDECEPRDPPLCDEDADCAEDQVCKERPGECDPSSCSCDDGTWGCTADCNGSVCVNEASSNDCEPRDPPLCETDADCGENEVCKERPDSCDPSNCGCTEQGDWNCTRDCGGTVCVPTDNACPGENPAGCSSDEECGEGQICEETPNCVSSTCSCDGGSWVCTDDCGGGECVNR